MRKQIKMIRILDMKKLLFLTLSCALLCAGCSSAQESKEDSFIPEDPVIENIIEETSEPVQEEEMKEILITIEGIAFTAALSNTTAANEFYESLPITFEMQELNGNEFYVNTENAFTADPVEVNSINTGEIKLYNDDCIVLFYDTFETEYSYTDIASIDDVSGLAELISNSETITVTFDQN